jgi:hypothetical protein
MQRVRKILVRTNAIKKIVAMADAELRGQEWLNLKFDAERPIRDKDWNLSGEGELVVVLNDAYLGTIQLTLTQQIEVSHDRLFVACNLKDASHSVERYDSTLTLVPGDNGDAKFSSTLSLQINTTANIFSRASVENGIRSAAKKALEDQANALRLVIAEKDGELFILPELKGD